jgi:hypothetical protein
LIQNRNLRQIKKKPPHFLSLATISSRESDVGKKVTRALFEHKKSHRELGDAGQDRKEISRMRYLATGVYTGKGPTIDKSMREKGDRREGLPRHI